MLRDFRGNCTCSRIIYHLWHAQPVRHIFALKDIFGPSPTGGLCFMNGRADVCPHLNNRHVNSSNSTSPTILKCLPYLFTFSHSFPAHVQLHNPALPPALQSGLHKQLILLCISLEKGVVLFCKGMPACQVSRTHRVSWEHPVLVQKGIGFSSASQARKGRQQEEMLIASFLYLPMKLLQQGLLEPLAQQPQNLAEDPEDHQMVWKSCQKRKRY